MKVALAYSVFNGVELLEKSIRTHAPFVDDIIICYQTVSNRGNFNDTLEKDLVKIATINKVQLHRWNPVLSYDTKTNELNKHNHMIGLCRSIGATHMIISATDHFYQPDQFKLAIEQSANYNLTLTAMFTYYKHPTWQLTPIEDYYMPFMIRLTDKTRFERQSIYPYKIDPSLKINTSSHHRLFEQTEIMMHHYSMIRMNIMDKFKNAASPTFDRAIKEGYMDEWVNYDINSNPGVKYFSGRKIKIVENYFDI